jgi:hypothetical protein
MHEDTGSEDTSLLDSGNSSNVATLDLVDAIDSPTREWTGKRCEKCEAPVKSDLVTICRRCGWYPNLGIFVEVDPNWEADVETQSRATTVHKSHLAVWASLLPRWSWVIIASVLAVVAESVVARLATPADSSLRTVWSLGQLGAGLIIAMACHIFNFLVVAADDADFGVLDLLLRPLKLWIRAAENLPKRLWVANAALCGVTAAVMSVVVIGGIPYERLWDWGFQEPVKPNLMGAVMDRAKQLDSGTGADNLEDAVGDFAGTAGVEEDDKKKKEPAKPREKADCVILGFALDRDGRLDLLFLGTAHRGQLIYAGRVTPELPEEELKALQESLARIKTLKAFIPVEATGTWVQPTLTCRITFAERQRDGRLRDLQWDRLLGSLNVQR